MDGCSSALADKLGNLPFNISKDKNLARLLDSSHRDRPKGRRGILSWNFSLVMPQLNKAPFEPIKEASLKHLTFKRAFLLGQANIGVRFMLGKQILDTNLIGQRCPHIHYSAPYPEIIWPRVSRQCGPRGYNSPCPTSG